MIVNKYFIIHEKNTPRTNETMRKVRTDEELYELDTFLNENKKYELIKLYNIGDGAENNICVEGAIHYLIYEKNIELTIKNHTYKKKYIKS
jgi:hypothetical protein